MLRGPESVAQLNQVLVGRGVAGTDVPEAFAGPAGRITWKQVRDTVDDLGMRHVFYRQVLKPEGALASLVEKAYRTDGIELDGASIGVHWYKDGTPRAVVGAQFLDAVILNEPTIGTAADAWSVAQTVVASWPGFEPLPGSAWTAGSVADQLAFTSLMLMPEEGRGGFRFVWKTVSLNADGVVYRVALDANTGDVMSVDRMSPGGTCSYSTTYRADAVGVRQNPASHLSNHSTSASLWIHVGTPYTYEAHDPGVGGQIPHIEVLMGKAGSDDPWPNNFEHMCPGTWYGMVPVLQTGSAPPTYDNYEGTWMTPARPIVPGRAAGDAMYFARKTMDTLWSLGSFGWDGSGGTARILVDAYGLAGGPTFERVSGTDFPANTVVMPTDYQVPYSWSAALDMLAHEFGHGVVFTQAQLDNDNPVRRQLHEGFADVIAYIVEQQQQPSGPSTCESATPPGSSTCAEYRDWLMGEDNDQIKRRVDMPCCGMAFHKDQYPTSDDRYVRGNAMGVAFRLLTVGGTNPGCSSYPGCSTTVAALGLTKASKIFFRVIAFYADANTQWADLADAAKMAAADLYINCYTGYDALHEQTAANNAFTAIGYPGDSYYDSCDPD